MTRRGHQGWPAYWARRSRWWRWHRQGWWRADEGRVTAFVLVLAVAVLALAGLSLDGGLALAAKVKANGQAEAAARAGAQAIDLTAYRNTGALHLDATQARTAAYRYLATVGSSGTVSVSGDTVTVTITATQPTQLLGMVGIASLTVHATGRAHPVHDALTVVREFENSEVPISGN